MNKTGRTAGIAYILLASLFFICGTGISGFLSYQRLNGGFVPLWEGYHPLLLPRKEYTRELTARLENSFAGIHLYNTSVDYFNFDGLTRVPLAEIDKRFEETDPRYDPFMRNLRNYFFTDDHSYGIIYLPGMHNPFLLFRSLDVFFQSHAQVEWILPGMHLLERLLHLMSFVLIAVVMIIFSPGRRWQIPLFALPWLPFVFFGTFHLMMCSAVLFYFFCSAGKELTTIVKERLHHHSIHTSRPDFRSLIVRSGLTLVVVAAFWLSGRNTASAGLPFLGALTASLSLIGVICGLTLYRYRMQAHPHFFRIPLGVRRKFLALPLHMVRLALLLLFIFSLPFLVGKIKPYLSVRLPVPQGAVGDTSVAPAAGYLPGVQDYAAHKFFQTYYLYDAEYRYPELGEVITLTSFTAGENGIIVQENLPVTRIGEEWYEKMKESAEGSPILRMLFQQGEDKRAVFGKIRQKPLTKREFIIYFFGWFIVQLPGLFSLVYLTPVRLYDMKSLELRRKFQAA